MKKWLAEKWKTLTVVAAAIALALLGRKATKLSAKIDAKERTATDLLNSGISTKLVKGRELLEEADHDKNIGVVVRAKMEEHLEKIGEKDETLDAIADRFNSRRMRGS